MKTYNQFINENNQTDFDQLEEHNYIRIWRDGNELGNFRVREMMNTDSTEPGADNMMVQKINQFGDFDPTDGLFNISKSDFQYTFKKLNETFSSGIVFIYNNKILLVQDVNKDTNKTCSFPKGSIEQNETIVQAAIREVSEEIGIGFPIDNLIKKEPKECSIFKEDEYKTYFYFIVKLNTQQFKTFFNVLTIPKENLQANEIKWAGFVNKEKAEEMIAPQFQKLLDLI